MESPFKLIEENKKESKEKSPNKNCNEKLTQFYLLTLEDINGERQQIKIYKNSDAEEIAFNFCKKNNLDYKSMKYIKKNIQKIIEKFDEPNHKIFFLDNSYSSIQEVDEENLISENTLIDNEVNKDKNNNKNRIKEIKFNNYVDTERKIKSINSKNCNGNINKRNLDKIEEYNRKDNSNIKIDKNEKTENKLNNIKNNKNNNLNNNEISYELIKNKTINEIKENKNNNTLPNVNRNEIQNQKKKEKNNKYSINFQKTKNSNKFDFSPIKERIIGFKLKHSTLNNSKKKIKENINKENIQTRIEKNNKLTNNQNNSNLNKQNIFKDKDNIPKKNEFLNENIIDNYFKHLNKSKNSKLKNYNEKNEDTIRENKTFMEKNNKRENLNQGIKKNKRRILLHHTTNILNNNINQSNLTNINENIKLKERRNIYSSRLTSKSPKVNIHIKENSNSQISSKQKKEKMKNNKYSQSKKEAFINFLSDILTHRINQNCCNQINNSKIIINNRRSKNKKRKIKNIGDISKSFSDLIKSNDRIRSRNNYDNIGKIIETEINSQRKNKKIHITRNGLNKMDDAIASKNNTADIFNPHYLFNKRLKKTNNRIKKNLSMNLPKYFSNNEKYNKSKKNSTEINVSNIDTFTNLNNNYAIEENNIRHKKNINFTSRNRNIIPYKSANYLNLLSSKKDKNKILNTNKQLPINNVYNTNIKNNLVINTMNSMNSDKARKQINPTKNIKINCSSKKKFRNCHLRNINSSYSVPMNTDCNLNILTQCYTINNTINITNNNSLMGNSQNNHCINQTKNIKNNKNDKVLYLINKLYKYLEEGNIGFILLNKKQKINNIFIKNNLILNKEQETILEKIFGYFLEIYKSNKYLELCEDKIIINKKSFLKYIQYIFDKKLNDNERNIFLSIESNNDCDIIKNRKKYNKKIYLINKK